MASRDVRTARVVFEDHLRITKEGSVEEDLARNYAANLVVLTGRGLFHGHDGLRQLADVLRRELPNCTFTYRTQLVEGDVAFLEWTARADGARVDDGADSYVIRDGRIMAQTIHYTVTPEPPKAGR
ncbi:MAG: nuclear transport factor 2 family protein [Acidobacteria bacterium]|nr:nuclear transport factor 2 family protein [Acidobacteriota bacterium]